MLQELSKFFTPPGFPTPKDGMKIPKELRDQFSEAITPVVSTLSDAGVMSFLNQAVISFEQIPKLVDEVSDVEWFAGRPYSSSDYFTICRNTAVNDANAGGVTAQHNKTMWYVDNSGATRQQKEQCIYRVEASSHKSSRINTVQGKQGTYSTCTIDFNQASYGSTVYDIKISGYSQAGFHRAGGYYCNSGLYAAFVSLNNQLGSNISHTQAYTNSQTVRQTFTFSSGFVHPVCEVTASTGGDAYFVEGSITITWS